jgi:hypothetical protein
VIHYQLRCSAEHEFDGWFADSVGFEKQAKRGLIECPTCGDVKVTRAMMAPAVTTRDLDSAPRPLPSPPSALAATTAPLPPAVATAAAARMPAQLRAMLQHMRAEIEKHCDYVGPSFADEARRMHHGKSDRRGIYGETTPDEAESLAEEGIEVSRIPWVPSADA